MNRGTARSAIYLNDEHRLLFLSLLNQCNKKFGARFIAFCLMGNHYHLLVKTPDGNLDRIMRHLNGLYTQRYNRATKRDGPLFRGRYKAILVQETSYLLNVLRYIHLNPIKAGLERELGSYIWSSHGCYNGARVSPKWLHTEEIWRHFEPGKTLNGYCAFMAAGIDETTKLFYSKRKTAPIFGDELYVKNAIERVPLSKRESVLTDYNRVKTTVPIGFVKESVADYFEVSIKSIGQLSRGSRSLPRKLAMYYCQNVLDYKLADISKEFDGISPGSVSVSNVQFSKKCGEKHIQSAIDAITKRIKSRPNIR